MESFHISFSLSASLDLSASVPAALLLIPSSRWAPSSPPCLLAAASAVCMQDRQAACQQTGCQFKMIDTLSASPVCFFNQQHQISADLNPSAVTVDEVEVSGCVSLALCLCVLVCLPSPTVITDCSVASEASRKTVTVAEWTVVFRHYTTVPGACVCVCACMC